MVTIIRNAKTVYKKNNIQIKVSLVKQFDTTFIYYVTIIRIKFIINFYSKFDNNFVQYK